MYMRKDESGQALVLVLLSLAVVLTIVLFILSRSVTDVSVSSGQAESVRAFSAAEAGIETALVAGAGSNNIGDASYTASVSDFAEGTPNFNYPGSLISGDTMTTWFVAHDSSGNIICNTSLPCFTGNTLKVCWGNPGTSNGLVTTPAVEVSVYYEATPGDLSTVRIARAAFDPNASRISSNSFVAVDAGTCSINGTAYEFQKTITLSSLGIPESSYETQSGLILARIKLLYNTDIAHALATNVVGIPISSLLPSQGQSIISTGTAGQSNRRISVFQGWPEFTFGGNSIYSPNSITK
jgi:Tfp pilus assembly protein PilX